MVKSKSYIFIYTSLYKCLLWYFCPVNIVFQTLIFCVFCTNTVKHLSKYQSYMLSDTSFIIFFVPLPWDICGQKGQRKGQIMKTEKDGRKMVGISPEKWSTGQNPHFTRNFSITTHNLDKLCVRFILGEKPLSYA